MNAADVVVGRQPIFDGERSVVGYELLFRTVDGAPGTAEGSGPAGDLMTADVVLGSISIGVDRLAGKHLLFCNASEGVLVGDVPILLEPDRTVIEILESIVPGDEVLAGCRRLRSEGFTLALDDVLDFKQAEPFLEVASIVKIDLLEVPPGQLDELITHFKTEEKILLAEKVETLEQLENCKALGFDLFQGYLLARPSLVRGRRLAPEQISCVQLATSLLGQQFSVDELEALVRRDPALTLQLLQVASIGASRGMQRSVRSVREALVLLGSRQLQSWISLILVAGGGGASQEQLTFALTRARMCELLAKSVDVSMAEMAFCAGMISSFDLLLGVSLDEILRGASARCNAASGRTRTG